MSFCGQMRMNAMLNCSTSAHCSERPVWTASSSLHALQGPCFGPQHKTSCSRRAEFRRSTARRCSVVVFAADVPTVADTKSKFYNSFRRPIPAVYNGIVQELLVQQHIIRYNQGYKYNEVFALGFVSVFDQVVEGLPTGETDKIFAAYVDSLDEDPAKYRADAERLTAWAKGLSGPSELKPDANGDEVQKLLAETASSAAEGNFLYSKFFAIGLFRLLELTGAKDPKALEALVKALNISTTSVNRDLLTYKGVLSKLSAAKELMREFIEREKRKQAEREAEKAAKKEADSATPAVAADGQPEKANA